MKNNALRLSKMFRTAHDGKTWHGQSVTVTLANVSASEAAAHPIPDSHSIWDYVLHIINWREYTVRNILDAEPYIVELNTDKDWTPITDFSEEAWQFTLEKFHQSGLELEKAIASFDESKLDETVWENKFSWYTLLHGVIQHDIYHSGQILLLKKMQKK